MSKIICIYLGYSIINYEVAFIFTSNIRDFFSKLRISPYSEGFSSNSLRNFIEAVFLIYFGKSGISIGTRGHDLRYPRKYFEKIVEISVGGKKSDI